MGGNSEFRIHPTNLVAFLIVKLIEASASRETGGRR
jgi:hypothetical protein